MFRRILLSGRGWGGPRYFAGGFQRWVGTASPQISRDNIKSMLAVDLSAIKLDSGGSNHLYAIFKLYNMPYLVTKGDKVVLPFKLKNASVGDELTLDNVTSIGSPNFTYNQDDGILKNLFDLRATVVEITREPYYEVYRKKPRCRRLKTFPVQPYQTILMINELKLK